jgi:hypothetical protein
MMKNLSVIHFRFAIVIIFSIHCGVEALSQSNGSLLGLAAIENDVKTKRISSFDRSGGNNDRYENIEDGEKLTLAEIDGSGIINHIWITIAPPPPGLNRNDIILRMYWDGNDFPSVESPIGPFFGQGWDESYPFRSILLSANPVEGRALVSYIKMPFQKSAKIEIENQTDEVIRAFYYYIDYIETEVPDNAGYFHAWYNHELTEAWDEGENEWGVLSENTGKNPKGEGNYLFVETEGKGKFIGVNYYVNNPGPIWYGEGDDMFYIDGSEMPTMSGTGTEDYFNTSWCPKEAFMHPYYGYPRVNGTLGWLGRTHVYRFHVEDPVYFDESLKFSIEHGHNNNLTLDLASVAYWYLDQPSKVARIPSKGERQFKREIGAVEIHRWRHEWRKSKGSDAQLWGDEHED